MERQMRASALALIPALSPKREIGASRRSEQHASLVDPIVAGDAAVELEVGVELVGVVLAHRGDLPIVEDAVLVELLDDLRADAGQLGEVVGCAARRGEQLEPV